MANAEGDGLRVECWSPCGDHLVCRLDRVSLRKQGTLFESASDPFWLVSVDGQTETMREALYYRGDDGSAWDAKVHSILQFPGEERQISFQFEHSGPLKHPDVLRLTEVRYWDVPRPERWRRRCFASNWQFQHWDGSVWRATILPILHYSDGNELVFNLKRLT